jgi:hypothetical protein
MGEAKRRKQMVPKSYGSPLLYDAHFWDCEEWEDPQFSFSIQIPRRGTRPDQLQTAIKIGECLHWCLGWRDEALAEWRLENADPRSVRQVRLEVCSYAALGDINTPATFLPTVAAYLAKTKLGFMPEEWAAVVAGVNGLTPEAWVWELWPPEEWAAVVAGVNGLTPEAWVWELWPPEGEEKLCHDVAVYAGYGGENTDLAQQIRQHQGPLRLTTAKVAGRGVGLAS